MQGWTPEFPPVDLSPRVAFLRYLAVQLIMLLSTSIYSPRHWVRRHSEGLLPALVGVVVAVE